MFPTTLPQTRRADVRSGSPKSERSRSMTDEPPRPQWAPRVRMALIKSLYEADAAGLADDDLVNEVGHALLMRCESIYRVTERRCPDCGEVLEGAHDVGSRDRTISCPGCGWISTWRAYHRSYKGNRIHGGRAYREFVHFLCEFPTCRTKSSKMLAIDRLIHAVHGASGNVKALPGAQNLPGRHSSASSSRAFQRGAPSASFSSASCWCRHS